MIDVVVIGAGPAGCTAARTLAAGGFRVLLAEKCRLPRTKSCSGILIQKSMDLVKRYYGEMPPPCTQCAPADNRGMVFTNDKGMEYRFEQKGLNIWRHSFDGWLAGKAREAGAEIRDCTTALSCDVKDDYVTVTFRGEETYTADTRYVLDCEGVVGCVKRKLLPRNYPYITTFQTFNEGTIDCDPHYFYAYLQPAFSAYDAWFNVKDNMLVLGVSVKDRSSIPSYYQRFIAFMQERHGLRISRELKAEKWLMPHIRPGCHVDYGVGRVLFAGETAGFLNPMGEGISAGLESGYAAASAVAENFENAGRVYDAYRQGTAGLKTYMERQWSFVAQMADTFREMKL